MIKDYGHEINWSVAGLFAHDRFIHTLIDVLKDLGYENPIKIVYGSIPCIMSGGVLPPLNPPKDEVMKILDEYNDRGVGCRLTFSSVFVKEEGFEDETCDTLLEHLNKMDSVKNGVIISDPRYAQYVRNKYPNLEIIASYMKSIFEAGLGNETPKFYNDMFKDFDYITVNPYKIMDYEFINSIDNKDKVIFHVNSRELPNDPLMEKFYAALMKINLKALGNIEHKEEDKALDEVVTQNYKIKASYPLAGVNFSQSEIEDLLRMGFKNFSILGRENDGVTFVRDLGEYLFVPNLYNRIAQAILRSAV